MKFDKSYDISAYWVAQVILNAICTSSWVITRYQLPSTPTDDKRNLAPKKNIVQHLVELCSLCTANYRDGMSVFQWLSVYFLTSQMAFKNGDCLAREKPCLFWLVPAQSFSFQVIKIKFVLVFWSELSYTSQPYLPNVIVHRGVCSISTHRTSDLAFFLFRLHFASVPM